MAEPNKCPLCGRELSADTPQGLCPACLFKRGLETNTLDETADDVGNKSDKKPRWTPPSVEELAGLFPELEILEFIGRGGMGAVYKVRQKELNRIAALKILPPEIGRDDGSSKSLSKEFAQRFTREAQAMARLNHPNIVTIYDFGRREITPSPCEGEGGERVSPTSLYFFLMEYVDGLSLRQVLDAGGVEAKEALAIVPQICDALQYAHDNGIVHRDIKPENILLHRDGRVKIADFGLAKLMGNVINEPPLSSGGSNGDTQEETPGLHRGLVTSPEMNVTMGQSVMGTPKYMAPEQIARPADVDHRADIYSLGVVFYQMLTGELPKGKFQPPSKKVLIDVRLDEVVLRALEKDPTRRYQNVSEVKTQVETIISTPRKVEPSLSSLIPPTPEAARQANAAHDAVREAVKAPAIGLLVAVGINLAVLFTLMAMILLYLQSKNSNPGSTTVTVISPLELLILLPMGFILNGLILLGALCMMRLRHRGLAIIGSIFAMITAPGNILGLPMGIWSLVILSRRNTTDAFTTRQNPKKPAGVVVPILLCLAGLAWLGVWGYLIHKHDTPARVWTDLIGFIVIELAALVFGLRVWKRTKSLTVVPAILLAGCLAMCVFVVWDRVHARKYIYIHGMVFNKVTSESIQGARLTAVGFSSDNSEIGEAYSDYTGSFQMRTWRKSQTIDVIAKGYKPLQLHLKPQDFQHDQPIGLEPVSHDTGKTSHKSFEAIIPTTQPESSPWQVTLPSGAVVELLGVSESPSTNKPWWQPDGSPLAKRPYERILNTHSPRAGYHAYELAIRLSNLPKGKTNSTWAFEPSSSWNGWENGTVYTPSGAAVGNLRVITLATPDSTEWLTVKFGLAAGPWNDLSGSNGKQIHSFGGPVNVTFSPASEKDGDAVISASHNAKDQAVRIIAITNEGKKIPGRQDNGFASDVQQLTATFDGVRLADIKEFRFQTRPYEWAEFKNVALTPSPSQGEGRVRVNSDASPNTPQTQPVEKTSSPQDWRTQFNQVYRLDYGEPLRRIAPPFIPEREDWFREENPSQYKIDPTPPDYFIFHWAPRDEKLRGGGYGFTGGDRPMGSILHHVLQMPTYDYLGAGDILKTQVPGDWIVNTSSQISLEQKLMCLEDILQNQLKKNIRFERRDILQDVIVVKGKFQYHRPANARYPDEDGIYIYAETIDSDDGGGGRSGSGLSKLIQDVGNNLQLRTIDVTEPYSGQLNWFYNSDSYASRMGNRREELTRKVLENVAKQTSLTFTIEKRKEPVWFVLGPGQTVEDVLKALGNDITSSPSQGECRVGAKESDLYKPALEWLYRQELDTKLELPVMEKRFGPKHAKTVQMESKLKSIEKLIRETKTSSAQLMDKESSQALQELILRETKLKLELDDARQRFGPDHKALVGLKAKLEAVQKLIHETIESQNGKPVSPPEPQPHAVGKTLSFRIAPDSPANSEKPSLDDKAIQQYIQSLVQGHIGEWWKDEKDASKRPATPPAYIWLPVRDKDGLGRLITAESKGKAYLLVSNKPEDILLPPADGGPKWGLVDVSSQADPMGQPAVGFHFDEPGGELFEKLTSTHKGQEIAIIVDGEVVSAPTIQSAFRERGQITGNFTQREVNTLVTALRNGMPAMSPASQPASIFKPVIELTLNQPMSKQNTPNCFLDLDTGKLISLSERPARDDSSFKWIRENGIDVVSNLQKSSPGLTGFDMIAMPTSDSNWNDTYIDSLHQRNILLPLMKTLTPGNPVYLVAKETPTTFVIKTREGSVGLLQIVGFEDNPRGTKIRYKLLKDSALPPATTQPTTQPTNQPTTVPPSIINAHQQAKEFLNALQRGATVDAYKMTTSEYRKVHKGGLEKLLQHADLSKSGVVQVCAALEAAGVVISPIRIKDNNTDMLLGLGMIRCRKGYLIRDIDVLRNENDVKKYFDGFKEAYPNQTLGPFRHLQSLPTTQPANNVVGQSPTTQNKNLGEFYIYGKVKYPGVYSLTRTSAANLKTALLAAKIETEPSRPETCILIQNIDSDNQTTITVNINDLFEKNTNNIVIRPNDLIYVGREIRIDDVIAANPSLAKIISKRTFGPVLERTINDDGVGKDCFIDLDTGKLFTPSSLDLFKDRAKAADFIRSNGIDAMGETKTSLQGLMGMEMIVIPIAAGQWEKMTPKELKWNLADGKAGSPVPMSGKGDLPATYLYQTREGGMGMLQITNVQTDKDPRHIKIRWKRAR